MACTEFPGAANCIMQCSSLRPALNGSPDESTTPSRWKHRQPRAIPGAPARHWLHGGGGVRLFDHGLADETPVQPLCTAADFLFALPIVPDVLVAADRLAAIMDAVAAEQPAAALVPRRTRRRHARELRFRGPPLEPRT